MPLPPFGPVFTGGVHFSTLAQGSGWDRTSDLFARLERAAF